LSHPGPKSLKIPEVYLKAARKTDNTMFKKKNKDKEANNGRHNTTKKLKIEQDEPH
jgi:hypothetical protein